MSLSFELRKALGDNSGYVNRQLSQSSTSTVQTQMNNARTRLNSVGVDTTKDKSDQNFLLKALDVISRPGYAADSMIREFTNPYAGSTPGISDPLKAYWRGITGKEKSFGKDIMQDLGLNGDTGVFGGQAKIYNPSVAGAAGLALDIFNPLDLVNWIGFGVGDDIVKGSAKGVKALEDAFGSGAASQIADLIKGAAKTADTVADATKAVDTVSDATKAIDVLDDLGASDVGSLIKQVMNKADQANVTDKVSELIKQGLEEKGLQATSKLDYKAMKPLQIGLQNPLTIGNSGMSVKLPGYEATKGAAKLPILYPGKNIAGTFKNIPGSEYLTYAVGSIAKKIADTKVGQTLGRAFSTAFVPNTVPSAVIKKEMTTSNLDDLMSIAKTQPDSSPLTVDELKTLQEELANTQLKNTFDYAEGLSAGELKAANDNYLSLNSLAKQVGIKGISTDDMTQLLSDTPFEKTITELYDDLRKLNPTGAEKDLFTQAAKLRKVMDLMYDQVPEGLKPYFSGIVKAQNTDLYPTDITTHRLGMNTSTSPLMAYQFEYKGVPVSVVVNSGENFNSNAWARVGSTLDALDELPETAIQAIKGQIDVSPIPIKNPDTSMTIGDTIVLGRIDTPTVSHEYGHIWDSVAGDKDTYSKAILNDSSKIDNVITSDDLYSDYARSLFSSDNDIGIKEDLADSVSDYLRDRKSFAQSYPARAKEIERMLSDSSISPKELAKLVGEQRTRATNIANIPRTESQIQKMMDSVDKYAQSMSWEPGTKAYSAFRQNFSKLFEETNWKTKQWQEQVGAVFQGLSEDERKQIMDAAAQITGSEIPKAGKDVQPAFANYNLYHVSRGGTGDKILEKGFKPGSFFGTSLKDSASWAVDRWLDEGNIDLVRAIVDTDGYRVIDLDDEKQWSKVLDTIDPNKNKDTLQNIDKLGYPRSSIIENNKKELAKIGDMFIDLATSDEVGETLQEAIVLNKGVIKRVEKLPEGTLNYFNSEEFNKVWKQAESKFSDTRSPEFIKYLKDQVENNLTKDLGIENYNSSNPLFSKQDFPVFSSKLQEATDNMPNSMSVDQFQKYLDGKGIKKEEMKWTFMDDLLDGKDKVTKQEVQNWVAGNKLEVNEVWRTGSRSSEIENIIEDWDDAGLDMGELGDIWDKLQDDGYTGVELASKFKDELRRLSNGNAYIPSDLDLAGVMNGGSFSKLGTKFAKYTQPGGEGYTELIFTLPEDYNTPKVFGKVSSSTTTEDMDVLLSEYNRLSDDIDNIREEYGRNSPEYLEADARLTKLRDQVKPHEPSFTAPYHWDDTSNPVAHTRFDTRYTEDGKKVLFIDEIQSDWHQHGRDSGYMDPNTGEILSGPGKGGEVADAPFKTNWDEYVQKRMLRYAADNGYDGIAWSTGKQQAERWSQSVTEGVDTLQYNHTGHNLSGYKNGERVLSEEVKPEQLESMVGKDIARQLLDESEDTFKVVPVEKGVSEDYLNDRALEATEGMDPVQMSRWLDKNQDMMEKGTSGFQIEDSRGNRMGYVYPDEKSAQKAINDLTDSQQRVKVVSGTNVTVGGEGMRKFYDQQIPSNFKKLGKKFGLSVDTIDLSGGGTKSWELAHDEIDNWGHNYSFVNKKTGEVRSLYEDSEKAARDRLLQWVDDEGKLGPEVDMVQQGIWLTPESRMKITQQSFPLYADQKATENINLTDGWSDRQVNALDNFLKWRNSVVKQYRQMGIPINELEKYVPFIPTRGLKTPEADTLRTVFGTGVKDATTDNFDTLMAELVKRDPNLKARTTNATRPSEVNAMLKKPWLTEDAAVAMSIRGSRAIKAEEFSNFADEFVKTYGLSMEDLGKSITGSSIPDGYSAFKIGKDTNGTKVFQPINSIPSSTEAGIDVTFLPKDMVDQYNEYSKVMFNTQARNGVLDLYDQLNRVYKKTAYLWNPGHIARDFEGNVFNNYLMGVKNPMDYADGLKVVNKAEGSITTASGEYTYKEIRQMAEKMGVIDSEMAYEIPTLSGKTESKYTSTMRKATYATDGWTRATGFVYNLKQGMKPAQAAAQTKKFLFDYFDLTPFERNTMRRIVPFYTWMRKNIPLQLEVMLKNPRIYSRINRIQDAAAGEPIDWSEKPDYIQDSMAVQSINSPMYSSMSLPYQDLTKIPVGADMDAMGNLLSSVSPLIRAPIESITNQKWWTGNKLEDYSGEKADIPALTTLIELLTGKQGPQVDARVTGNLLSNIPILTRAGNLVDSATGKETSDVKNLSRLSSSIGGPSFYDASSVQNSANWQERQRLLDLIQLLQDQGIDVPSIDDLTPNKSKSKLKAPKKSDMKGYDKVPHKS